MVHFETIWNEAESVSSSYTGLDRKEIFKSLRKALDDLSDADKEQEYEEALGDMLFGLCALCAHLDSKKKMQINSARALAQAIQSTRSKILDPDPPE